MAKDISRTVTIYVNDKQVESTLKSLEYEMKKLQKEQRQMIIGTDEYVKHGMKIREIKSVLEEQKRAMQDVEKTWGQALEKLGNIGNIVSGYQALGQMINGTVSSLKDLVAAAAELDDAYANVMKTTGLTHKQVQSLNDAFKKIDTRTSREQLNQLAYEAGKLGINTEELVLQFVKASDKINIALGDVLGEGAMVTIGKLTQVYENSTRALANKGLEERMMAIGNAVNQLGKESTANEHYLVEFTARLGGIATQAGLSADAVLGFASALDQDMQKVEMSATAFQKLIQKIIAKPAEFASIAGKPINKFNKLIGKDMNEAIKLVLKGFQGANGFQKLQPIFADLGLDGARAAAAISSMANSLDKITIAQESANKQIAYGDSILKEYNTKNSSMQATAEKARKNFEDMRIELGEKLYPVIINLTKTSTAALKGVSGYVELFKQNKAAAIALITPLMAYVAHLAKAVALKAKEAVIDAARNTLKKAEAVQQNVNNAQAARENLLREKSLLALRQYDVEMYKSIIARKQEFINAGQMNVVLAAENSLRSAETALIKQQTVVTEANTVAQKANKAVLASTPWGLVTTLIAGTVAAIANLTKESRNTKKEIKEVNKQIGQQGAKAQYLFDKLENATRGTINYKEALQELEKMFPDIIQKYKDEQGDLFNLADAHREVVLAIREQIVEEAKLAKYKDIGGSFNEKREDAMSKMYDYLVGKNGAKGQAQYNALLQALPQGYDSKVSFASVYKTVKETTGVDLSGVFAWNSMKRAVDSYVNAVNEAYDANKKWSDIYGNMKPTATANAGNNEETGKKEDERKGLGYVPDTDKAKRKWDEFVNAYNVFLSRLQQKDEKGLAKIFGDIDTSIMKMKQDLEGVKGEHPEAAKMLAKIRKEAMAWKNDKLDDYLKDISDNIAKIDKDSKPASSNSMLEEVKKKAEEARANLQVLAQLQEQISQDKELKGLNKNTKKQLEKKQMEIEAATFRLQNSIFNGVSLGVDTSGYKGQTTTTRASQKRTELDNERKKYEEEVKKIDERIEANKYMFASGLASPEKKKEILEQNRALEEQRKRLGEVYEETKKFVDNKYLKLAIDELVEGIQKWSDMALQAFDSINTILDNQAEKELKAEEEKKDKKLEILKEQYKQGYLSEEEYTEKTKKLEDGYDTKRKEIEKEQWQREKAYSIASASIAGALSILRVWASEGTVATHLIESALVAATTGLQIAAITSQAAPYAKGGYTKEPTILVGERGQEWVASNRLLNDPKTAPIISALERYQRSGSISMDAFNTDNMAQVVAIQAKEQAEMLNVMKQLASYIQDPNNRRAVISRTEQERFDSMENFLRQRARW